MAEHGAFALRLKLLNSPMVRTEPPRLQKESVFSRQQPDLVPFHPPPAVDHWT